MVFSAFCLEAFLNHLGKLKHPKWRKLRKKRISPKTKLNLISEEVGFTVDYGERPFKTLPLIFRFRNKLAHAETVNLSEEGEIILDEDGQPPKPLTWWEKLVTIEGAQCFVDDSEAMIGRLRELAGLKDDPVGGKFDTEVVKWETRTYPSSDTGD